MTDLAMRIANAIHSSSVDLDRDLADLTVADAIHRVARVVVENAREAGLDVRLSDVQVGLAFRQGSAHWTARIAHVSVTAGGPCEALERLAERAAMIQ